MPVIQDILRRKLKFGVGKSQNWKRKREINAKISLMREVISRILENQIGLLKFKIAHTFRSK